MKTDKHVLLPSHSSRIAAVASANMKHGTLGCRPMGTWPLNLYADLVHAFEPLIESGE
jgi:hypothetical protein